MRFPNLAWSLFAFALPLLGLALALPSRGETASSPTTLRWLTAEDSAAQPKPETLGKPGLAASPWGAALSFDGQGDALVYPENPVAGLKAFTIQLLFRPQSDGAFEQRFLHFQDEAEHRILMELRLDQTSKRWCLDTHMYLDKPRSRTLIDWNKLHSSDEWHWVALCYDGRVMRSYVDGEPQGEQEVVFEPMGQGRCSFGMRLNKRYFFRGQIRELRVDPSALPPERLERKTR